MKIKQLMLAPVALGLAVPTAATAATINMDAVNQYANQEQVTSINQFSDVRPSDWAYQALSNLIERYGCVAGYPDGTYKGGQSMTRYEAAALLNACLDRITEVTDELQRLLKEFQTELAVIRGRVDKLEAKVGQLEATQFSTTTKLSGQATFVVGAVNAGGNSRSTSFDISGKSDFNNKRNAADKYNARYGATTFNYDLRLNFMTSFTGKDLLYTRLRSGNFSGAFGGNGSNLTFLDVASNGYGGLDCNGTRECSNSVGIDRLYYTFPVGKEFTFTAGPIARNTELLGANPSVYATNNSQKILDFFATHGVPGTYNKATGAAVAAVWKQNVKPGQGRFSVSASYVAPQGGISQAYDGNPYECSSNEGGVGTDCSRASFLTQVAYTAPQWGLSAAYRYGQAGSNFRRGTNAIADNSWWLKNGSSNSLAVNAYWQPLYSGWAPSVSVGWGINSLAGNRQNGVGDDYDLYPTQSQSWMVGLQWSDVIGKGNSLGIAAGQPTFGTSLARGTRNDLNTTPYDGNYAFEAWYAYRVSDNITITPSVFYLSRPLGEDTITADSRGRYRYGDTFGVFGGLVQTTFRF